VLGVVVGLGVTDEDEVDGAFGHGRALGLGRRGGWLWSGASGRACFEVAFDEPDAVDRVGHQGAHGHDATVAVFPGDLDSIDGHSGLDVAEALGAPGCLKTHRTGVILGRGGDQFTRPSEDGRNLDLETVHDGEDRASRAVVRAGIHWGGSGVRMWKEQLLQKVNSFLVDSSIFCYP